MPKAHSKISSPPKIPVWRWTGTYATIGTGSSWNWYYWGGPKAYFLVVIKLWVTSQKIGQGNRMRINTYRIRGRYHTWLAACRGFGRCHLVMPRYSCSLYPDLDIGSLFTRVQLQISAWFLNRNKFSNFVLLTTEETLPGWSADIVPCSPFATGWAQYTRTLINHRKEDVFLLYSVLPTRFSLRFKIWNIEQQGMATWVPKNMDTDHVSHGATWTTTSRDLLRLCHLDRCS